MAPSTPRESKNQSHMSHYSATGWTGSRHNANNKSHNHKKTDDHCHNFPAPQVPHVKDVVALTQNLGGAQQDLECFYKLLKDETPAEDQMEHNYMLGDQLLYMQGQFERLLRKQVAQAAYKLEFLLTKLKTVETDQLFKERKHRALLEEVISYNRHHFVEPHIEPSHAVPPTAEDSWKKSLKVGRGKDTDGSGGIFGLFKSCINPRPAGSATVNLGVNHPA